MMDDEVTKLLRMVADGLVPVEDARKALLEVELSEQQLDEAIDRGVFTEAEVWAPSCPHPLHPLAHPTSRCPSWAGACFG